jgi:microcompartment protein CcmK/EutM
VVTSEYRAPELTERRLVVLQPVDERDGADGRMVVAVDPIVSASDGALVWFVGGSDATDALSERTQPVDAAVVGLVSSMRPPATPTPQPSAGRAAGGRR